MHVSSTVKRQKTRIDSFLCHLHSTNSSRDKRIVSLLNVPCNWPGVLLSIRSEECQSENVIRTLWV